MAHLWLNVEVAPMLKQWECEGNVVSTPWRRMEEWNYSSTILDHGTRWSWVASITPLPIYTRGKPPLPVEKEIGWTPEPVWVLWIRKKCTSSAGNRTSALQPITRRYTDWTIPAPALMQWAKQMYGEANVKLHECLILVCWFAFERERERVYVVFRREAGQWGRQNVLAYNLD
jgi:hypothetical protein